VTRSVNGREARTHRRSRGGPPVQRSTAEPAVAGQGRQPGTLAGADSDKLHRPGTLAGADSDKLHRPGTARIAVDLLGGDDAPAVVVDGARHACGVDPDLHLLLVGPSEVADEIIAVLPREDRERVRVEVVPHRVGMSDAPAGARRADATVRAAAAALAEQRVDGMVSAGPSGATVTAAVLGLGRMAGVRRPALAATLPARDGPVVLLDVGASLDPDARTLAGHALLGAAFAQIYHRTAQPRVGLLSIGAEAGKGDRARRAAEGAIAARPLPSGARYVGLVEGHDVPLGGPADVVVTDGFTGNVLLKGVEGAYLLAGSQASRLSSRSGSQASPDGNDTPRGAVLLGVPGAVVVCHGAATGADLASGIALAANLHRAGVVARLCALVAELTEVMP
jgi:glycerol-3-phosphate acyltransferase PlsX